MTFLPLEIGKIFFLFTHFFHTARRAVRPTLALVSFSDGVPVLLVHLDAMLAHKSVDKFVLSLEQRRELVERSPQLHIEAIADSSDEQVLGVLRQVVIRSDVLRLEIWNSDYHCTGIVSLNLLWHIIRLHFEKRFENATLDAAASEVYRVCRRGRE